MIIQVVKELPEFGHMLDTQGKDKLAKALSQTVSELSKRPKIEHKVVFYQTPEDDFKFVANMIDSYVAEQDKGSEGANQND